MPTDGVNEMQGVYADLGLYKCWVHTAEYNAGVGLNLSSSTAVMSPNAARRLARMLYRQSRRWEEAHSK